MGVIHKRACAFREDVHKLIRAEKQLAKLANTNFQRNIFVFLITVENNSLIMTD